MAKVCHSCGQGPGVRQQPKPLDGGHEAALRSEPPEGADPRGQGAAARVRLHALPQGRQGHQGPLAGRARRARVGPQPRPLPRRVEGALAHLESRRAGDQRPQRLPGRRRRHGRQHGADAAGVPGGGRPAGRRSTGRSTRSAATRSSSRSPAPRCWARAATAASSSPSSSAAPPRSSSRAPASSSTRCSSAPPWRARPSAPTPRSARRPRARCSPSCATWPRTSRRDLAHMDDAAAGAGRRGRRAGRACSPTSSRRRSSPARRRCARGPELLPVLREAGVVDAGGYGVIVIFAGVVAALRGEAAPAARAPRAGAHHAIPSTSPRPTATARTSPSPARDLDAARYVGALEALGDSVLVVGDRTHAEGPRPHRRPRDGDRGLRRRRRGLAPRRRRHARAGRPARARAWPPTATRRARRARGVLAVVSGPGMARAVRVAGRPRARRRPDAQPVHARAAGRHPRRARRGGRRPAQQPQRDHGGRARRRAGREGRARGRRRARSRPGWPPPSR